ncbi:MAG: hypothetical protein QOJ64_3584 [Acidobacteriota bacterium]|jgi:ferric-dicitrate binding protein FerR (iron transport regulator)|nr:hypothetical protein [Acidobacteriota bacterium]
MFSQHVTEKLSAYCHGELADEESRLVAEHMIGCPRCRREFEEIKLGVKFAELLPSASAPATLWNEIESALSEDRRSRNASPTHRSRRLYFGWKPLAGFAGLVLVVGGIWFIASQRKSVNQIATTGDQPGVTQPVEVVRDQTKPVDREVLGSPSPATQSNKPVEISPTTNSPDATWDVARLEGAPTLGANKLEGNGRLAVGEWLETDSSSRAQINVANIGHVNIEPNSRVQLVGTNSREHRLAMTQGRLHAMISAPPRLFIVETPSAVAIDLGCSYTLEVDKIGRSILHVTSGWVELESKGRESIVPAGAECITQPGKGPGTPYFDDASGKFRDALTQLDFHNGGARALAVILAESRADDTLTLWHLLSRTRGPDRSRVYDRMAALVAPPTGVTRDGVLRLDKGMLGLWKTGLEAAWYQ